VGNCNLPAGLGPTLAVNQIIVLSANSDNGSIVTWTNSINSSFDAGGAGGPERAAYALMALGLSAMGLVRRRMVR
jgi:hypothetical protein